MQDDDTAGGGADIQVMSSSSLFGGSNGSSDIGIPDFNEDDYLDLSLALNDEDGEEGEGEARDGATSPTAITLKEDQQNGEKEHTVKQDDIQVSINSPKDGRSSNGTSEQQQHNGQAAGETSNTDNNSSDNNDKHNMTTSTNDAPQLAFPSPAIAHMDPTKPLTDSPSSSLSMKLPNVGEANRNSQNNAFVSSNNSSQDSNTAHGPASSSPAAAFSGFLLVVAAHISALLGMLHACALEISY
jgi:hypothetical protein